MVIGFIESQLIKSFGLNEIKYESISISQQDEVLENYQI